MQGKERQRQAVKTVDEMKAAKGGEGGEEEKKEE